MTVDAVTKKSGQTMQKKFRVAIRDTLAEEMRRDPKIILMGQDIGLSNGLFRLTEGLFDEFGGERVRDTPISETATVGAAIGMAIEGYRPVVEIAFSDLMLSCFDPITNQLAKIPYMFGKQAPVLPVVIRALTGAGLGVGAHHSQSIEALFAHMPGLDVLMPGTPRDAAGLLRSALRGNRPTIFLEHKMLLRDRGPVPDGDVLTPIGQAEIAREGSDLTIVGFALTRKYSLQAAEILSERGISAEVIDLRTVAPIDYTTVIASVARTGRLLVAQEGYRPQGIGAEVIAGVAASRACTTLKAPMRRVTPPFAPIPALKVLEEAYLPSAENIAAMAELMMN